MVIKNESHIMITIETYGSSSANTALMLQSILKCKSY